MVTFTWENQGRRRTPTASIGEHLRAIGHRDHVLQHGAIQCGIVPATASFVPAAGDLFFLVPVRGVSHRLLRRGHESFASPARPTRPVPSPAAPGSE